MNQAFLWLYGGYGDCVAAYLNGGWGINNKRTNGKCGKGSLHWNKLISFKERYKTTKITAVVISGNNQSQYLARNNPYIDEVLKFPTLNKVNSVDSRLKKFILDKTKNISSFDEYIRPVLHKCPDKTNDIYLNETDKELYDSIIEETKGKYVLIHPFASIEKRMPVPKKYYVSLTEKIYNTYGIKSIILGGSYTKRSLEQNGNIKKQVNEESFEYTSDGIINTVNKGSVLLGSKLVKNSILTIGSWSCHTTCAMSLLKPTIIFTTNDAVKYLRPISRRKFPEALKVNETYITDKITDSMINRILKRLRKEFLTW